MIVSYFFSRDKVNLLYVSQKLRTVSKTPSLWHEFVWDYYDSREETCVKNTLKKRGEHIKRLAFPGYLAPKMEEILQYCSNVSHLSLPVVRLNRNQLALLGEAVKKMKQLHTLDIGMFTYVRHLLEIGLKLQNLTLYVTVYAQPAMFFYVLEEWARVKFRPPKLTIIFTVFQMPMVKELIVNWQQWNSKVPAGHTAWLKIYPRYKIPLNLSPVLPAFQLHLGQTAALPFVRAKQCGIQGMDYLQLTDCYRAGQIFYMAETLLLGYCPQFYNIVTSIHCVTHFDVSKYNCLLPSDIEQIAIVCPHLQQLKISRCCQCLTSLHGLQAIASHCHNFQGLNMVGISVSAVENQIQLWEILSNMKLTHLVVDYCIIVTPSTGDAGHKKSLASLYQRCSWLLALEIHCLYTSCRSCKEVPIENGVLSLSYLISLKYCAVHNLHSTTTKDILTSCKELRCYRIVNHSDPLASLSLAHNLHLQQLYVISTATVVSDTFMMSVSAHGGLVHVFLSVASISVVGIRVLIENSPKLTTFQSLLEIHEEGGRKLSVHEFMHFEKILKQKFCHHKLFYTGGYSLSQQNKTSLSTFSFLEQTDIGNLWDTY